MSKALAVQELRKLAGEEDVPLSVAIGRAFQRAAMLRDEGMKHRVEAALAVLVEDDDSHMGPPAVGYLRGRAQAIRDEAPNADNPQKAEFQGKLLEKAAEILEER